MTVWLPSFWSSLTNLLFQKVTIHCYNFTQSQIWHCYCLLAISIEEVILNAVQHCAFLSNTFFGTGHVRTHRSTSFCEMAFSSEEKDTSLRDWKDARLAFLKMEVHKRASDISALREHTPHLPQQVLSSASEVNTLSTATYISYNLWLELHTSEQSGSQEEGAGWASESLCH